MVHRSYKNVVFWAQRTWVLGTNPRCLVLGEYTQSHVSLSRFLSSVNKCSPSCTVSSYWPRAIKLLIALSCFTSYFAFSPSPRKAGSDKWESAFPFCSLVRFDSERFYAKIFEIHGYVHVKQISAILCSYRHVCDKAVNTYQILYLVRYISNILLGQSLHHHLDFWSNTNQHHLYSIVSPSPLVE